MSAQVLLDAAAKLEELLGSLRESWTVDVDGPHVYVTHPEERGNWVAYTGDEAGAPVYARWMALMDPIVGRLLVDVLEGCAQRALDPDWVAFAEALLAKAGESPLS